MDFEIDKFFGEIASIRMDIDDLRRWCSKYETFKYEWTTRYGTKIKLSNMTEQHLNNTIALVKRKDPTNEWLIALEQEKTYRKYRERLSKLTRELAEMEEVRDMVF